ncbi:MAG: TAXI family TRAP transporter solute-binding subunit [Alphaproteobacteria bacterium]
MSQIRIGTSEKGGTFWTEGEAIASLLEQDHGISSDILDAGQASIENARRLDAGLIELGFMASNWIGRAHRGDAPFDDAIDIRMVAPANSGAMFFIARADSDLTNVRDLVGKRVSIGPEGSGMVQHIHTMFGVLGISFDDFTPVYLSFEDGGRALEAGDVDAQWQCPYPNAVMRDISERMPVRVLDYDAPDLSSILDNVDHYRPATMPAGFFRGVESDTEQLAVVNIVAAHERTDPEVVRKFVTTMLNNLDELAEINPLFVGLDRIFEPMKTEGAAAIEFGGTPLHPGAVQAYRDAGYLT